MCDLCLGDGEEEWQINNGWEEQCDEVRSVRRPPDVSAYVFHDVDFVEAGFRDKTGYIIRC